MSIQLSLDEVFVISRIIKVEIRVTLTENLIIFWISQKTNLMIVSLYLEQKNGNLAFASSLTGSNTKGANLT